MKQFNNETISIIFFGNTKYSVIVAQALFQQFGLSAVVTTPDRPVGRNNILTPTPVKAFALQNHIPVIDTRTLADGYVRAIKSFSPDFLVVADYGLFLPDDLLAIPKYAALNVHPSLLPKYRGPTPVPAAILNGDTTTGVTIIELDKEIDHGPIVAQAEEPIKKNDTAVLLYEKLFSIGSGLIVSTIELYKKKRVRTQAQKNKNATFTKQLSKQDGYIDLANPPVPEKLDRMTRAFYPWPGVWTRVVLRSHLSEGATLVKLLPNKMIQVEGKKPMSYKDFINGYQQMLEEPVKKFVLSLQSS